MRPGLEKRHPASASCRPPFGPLPEPPGVFQDSHPVRPSISPNDRAPAFFVPIRSLSERAGMKKFGYVNVKVRRELASRLDDIAPRLGYEDRDELVEDAVRRFMDAVEPRRE